MIKILLAAAALAIVPALSFASCSSSHQAMSCAAGTAWDAESQSCVEQVSS